MASNQEHFDQAKRIIHVKIYCSACGTLRLHERIELPNEYKENSLRNYVALQVDPLCPGCCDDVA